MDRRPEPSFAVTTAMGGLPLYSFPFLSLPPGAHRPRCGPGREPRTMTRRKGETTGRINERDYPNIVELPVPSDGFRDQSVAMGFPSGARNRDQVWSRPLRRTAFLCALLLCRSRLSSDASFTPSGPRRVYGPCGIPAPTRCPGQRPHFANRLSQPPTRGDHLGGVAAMLVIAVARPLGSP